MKTITNNKPESSGDHINYISKDGLVTIRTKVASAKRWPQHDYPVVCLELRPSPGTRVQELPDGSVGVDVLLTHEEVARHIQALCDADPKAGYKVPYVAAKPLDRKAKWDEINRKRRKKRGNN
ncbi:MAG TPA: hypothetical protein VN673_04030 [Clostridia bacterium]|nr:hypothetical protein [Clostridia bacterium]